MGFLRLIGVLEVVGGIVLLVNRFVFLVLIFIIVIMFNVIVFYGLYDLVGIGLVVFCLLVSLVLVYVYRVCFGNLFSV